MQLNDEYGESARTAYSNGQMVFPCPEATSDAAKGDIELLAQ